MTVERATAVAVADTNVLVSALLKAQTPPARLLAAVLGGHLKLAFDARIVTEYRDVLLRPKFGFDRRQIYVVLAALQRNGIAVAAQSTNLTLPDPDGLKFVEVARAFEPPIPVITGNMRHFRSQSLSEGMVMTPREFLERLNR